MKLTKPSASLVTEFKHVASQVPHAQPRKMFGYDALFVNGNMAIGLWRNTCVAKLSSADQAALLARGAATPFEPMKGRVMTGWLELSEELAHDPEELLSWAERAVAYTATLPPKVRAPKTAGAKPSKAVAKKSTKKAPKKSAKKSAEGVLTPRRRSGVGSKP
ncbi:MAG: TfoX family protein [Myxococcales bacterium]|nr:MAG: TfoX family protein [Myxococcales bacterium]